MPRQLNSPYPEMKVTVTFFFSFPNPRLNRTQNSTNIKGISQESSINIKNEEYTITAHYSTKKEISFKKRLESGLNQYVRKNPRVAKCKFESDYVPNNKLFLPDKFNRKLTPLHVRNIVQEIAMRARVRFKNPDFFNS